MRVVVGLGNPGQRYAGTRHNFGFWVVDELARTLSLAFKPGKGDYLIAQRAAGELTLIKPTSFMNDSGLPVKEALAIYQATPEETLVVLDDIDLPLGTVRFRAAGGAGGHRGLESVIYHLESENIARLRLGIATDAPLRPSEDYVLAPFRAQDQTLVDETKIKAVEGLQYLLAQGMEATMTRYNTRSQSEESEGKN